MGVAYDGGMARLASTVGWLGLWGGLVAFAAACGDSSSSGGGGEGAAGGGEGAGVASGGGGEGVGGYPGTDPDADCPGKLEPREPAGQLAVVGDGTAASCTEQALIDAADAVNAAPEGGTISFDCGEPVTITLGSSLFIANTAILDGGGTVTLSGGGAVRVVELDHYVDFVLQRITIRDGFVAAGSENESGAGLLHPWFGTLEVIDVTFADNHSASLINDVGGGAIYAGGLTRAAISGSTFTGNSGSTGGGILSRSTNLTVVDSVFYENSATTYAEDGQYGNGGGVYIDRMWLDAPQDFSMCGCVFEQNHAKVHGSALFSYNLEGSGATIERTTFLNNDMLGSPGGTGSVYHEGVPLTVVGSTFAGNTTNAHAGGLFLGGGSAASIVSCTFDGNSTPGNAGALWAGNGAVDVTNTTFANNSADYGPVIFKGESGSVLLTNVVFANNTTENEFSALACHETFQDGGGNVQFPATKNNGNPDLPCAAGIAFADPGLAPLADNGGPTPTMALTAGSPAVDVSDECPEVDQRGMPRVGPCDAGAYELQ